MQSANSPNASRSFCGWQSAPLRTVVDISLPCGLKSLVSACIVEILSNLSLLALFWEPGVCAQEEPEGWGEHLSEQALLCH